mgnify:CR=1 FL=1
MPTKRTGFDALATVKALRLHLEDGTDADFDLSKELAVPRSHAERIKALERSPAQLAFWRYQAARAAGQARKAETERDRIEGETTLILRKWIDDTQDYSANDFGVLRGHLNADATVNRYRRKADAAKRDAEKVRAVADAVEHRMYVLRKLVDVTEYDRRTR